MNWVDLVVLALLALSALVGLARGFVRESLGLAAWVAAAVLAARLGPQLVPSAGRLIPDPRIAAPVTFLVVFAVLLVVFLLVAAALGGLARGSVLGGLDRLAGLGFGVLRGFAVLVIAAMLAASVWPVADWPASVTASRFLPAVRATAGRVSGLLPDHYRPDNALSGPDDSLLPPHAGGAS